MSTGKTIGLILIAAGVGICLLATAWIFGSYSDPEAGLRRSGALLGLALVLIVSAPVTGVGVFLLIRGRREAAELAEVEKERELLGMIQSQGQVAIPDAALELDVGRGQVKDWIYDLVDKELFTGYINWDDGLLYSRDAAQMREGNTCPNCGGELELAGKGLVQCPYCGAEVFLSD